VVELVVLLMLMRARYSVRTSQRCATRSGRMSRAR